MKAWVQDSSDLWLLKGTNSWSKDPHFVFCRLIEAIFIVFKYRFDHLLHVFDIKIKLSDGISDCLEITSPLRGVENTILPLHSKVLTLMDPKAGFQQQRIGLLFGLWVKIRDKLLPINSIELKEFSYSNRECTSKLLEYPTILVFSPWELIAKLTWAFWVVKSVLKLGVRTCMHFPRNQLSLFTNFVYI